MLENSYGALWPALYAFCMASVCGDNQWPIVNGILTMPLLGGRDRARGL